MKHILLTSRRLMAFACFTLLALVATPVLGADSSSKADAPSYTKLFKYLPTDSSSLAVIDVKAVRASPYFDRATDYLQSKGQVKGLTKLLQSDKEAIDDQSVDRVAVGFPAATGRSAPERSTAVLAGTFNESSLKSIFESEVEGFKSVELDGGLSGFKKENTVAVLLDEKHLLLITGPESYRSRALNTARGKAKSLADGALPTSILKELDTSRGIWMVNSSRSVPGAAEQGIVEIGLALGVADDLEIQAVTRSKSEESAKELEGQLSSARSSNADNPMVKMLGIGPLLKNLEHRRTGAINVATTSMTSTEVDTLIKRLEEMMGGSGSKPLQIPGDRSSDDSSEDASKKEAPSGDDGAEADFN